MIPCKDDFNNVEGKTASVAYSEVTTIEKVIISV
jgi:hypothetical protein